MYMYSDTKVGDGLVYIICSCVHSVVHMEGKIGLYDHLVEHSGPLAAHIVIMVFNKMTKQMGSVS